MNIRSAILIAAAFLILGFISVWGTNSSGKIPTLQLTANGIHDGSGFLMQDEAPDEGDGSEGEEGDDSGGDSDDGDSSGGDSEEGDSGEGDSEGDQPAEEEPSAGETDAVPPGTTDFSVPPTAIDENEQALQDAIFGYRDYEVTYDTTRSHRDQTPRELQELQIFYAGDESSVWRETELIKQLDLVETLADRYTPVEEQFAASRDTDFAPDDPDRTLNYYQPRWNPFSIPDTIPDELKPELEGGGLSGSVDPELLQQLYWAQYEANLRTIPLVIVGVMETGPYRGCMYMIWGEGRSYWLSEGSSHCRMWYGAAFSVTASTVSEDYVVLVLRGAYDRRCRYPATGAVARTFHVSR